MWFNNEARAQVVSELFAARRASRRRRHRVSKFESLEQRQMLTISVSLSGPVNNRTVVFLDDSSGIVDTQLTLRVNAASELEWSTDSFNFTNDLDTATGGTQSATLDNIHGENLSIFMGVGDDQVGFDLSNHAATMSVFALGFGPNDTIVGGIFGANSQQNFKLRGTEYIDFRGVDNNDTLSVTSGAALARVEGTPTSGGRAVTDELPQVLFRSLNTFEYSSEAVDFNASTVTFALITLTGANNYRAELGQNDVLIVEGLDSANDSFLLGRTQTGELSIANQADLKRVILDDDSAGASLIIRGFGGDDVVNATTSGATGNDVIRTPITFEGGAGFDQQLVNGDQATPIDEVIYQAQTTSNKVSLQYEDAANAVLMSILLTNVEDINDQLDATRAVIIGTGGVDNINYGPGDPFSDATVSVSRHATYGFNDKSVVVLNGAGGNDTFNIDNSDQPGNLTVLSRIVVDGGPNSGYDRIIVSNMGKNVVATKTTITANGFLPIAYSHIDRLRFDRGTLADVSALIALVNTTGPQFGFPTVNRTLTFKNNSKMAVEGSFVAVFTVPAGVSVDNGTGTTKFYKPGLRFIRFNIGAGRLEPGTEMNLNVRFRFANAGALNTFNSQGFKTDLLAGNGAA